MIIFLFLSLYFSTNNNIDQFKVTTCVDKDYTLIKRDKILKLSSMDKEFNFKDSDKYFLLDFYCYNNRLFFLEIEKKPIDNVDLFRHLVIYEIKDNLIEKEWISTPDEYFIVNNLQKEFYNYRNKLFFYNYKNYKIYGINYYDSFSENIEYRNYIEGVLRKVLYSNNRVVIDFKKDNSDNSKIYLLTNDTEKIIAEGLLIDFLSTDNNDIIAYRDINDKLAIYDNFLIETDINISDKAEVKLFSIKDRIYFFLKDNQNLKLGVIFTDENNRLEIKNIDDVISIDKIDNNIFYLKKENNINEIYSIKGNVTDLLAPEIFLKGAIKENPKYLEYSNFNQDFIYYKEAQIEIATDKNFNNILISRIIDSYNNSDKQSYDISRFLNWQNDTLYYIRVRYKDIFNRVSKWGESSFIITDLGKINSFIIKSKVGDSGFTKVRSVDLIFEKLGDVKNIEVSYSEKFDNSSFFDYSTKIDFQLEDRDGVHKLYSRAVIKDEDRVVAYSEILSSTIELNRSDIELPTLISPKESEIILEFPYVIKWNFIDNLNYNIIISKDIEFKNVVKDYYFIEDSKQILNYLEPGKYFLKLYAKDLSGNISRSKIIIFFVEDRESSTGCQF